MNQHNVIMALALAIRLRDAPVASGDEVMASLIQELSGYNIFSNRQIEKIIDRKISYKKIARISGKASKTGGSINPVDFEAIRDLMFSHTLGETDWGAVSRVVKNGTSQNFLSKLTGISKSTMNRKISESI